MSAPSGKKVIEKGIYKLNILLASPGNLEADRQKFQEIVKYINLDNGRRQGYIAEIVTWETHTRPAAGEYIQAVINKQFPDDIDIFVGMMGTHFGTPTKHWGSGTEEEFRIAYSSFSKSGKPEIMFYFSDAMPSIYQVDPEQLAKRIEFQKELKELGVYHFSYSDITEFQFDLHNHISSAIDSVMAKKDTDDKEALAPDESANSLKNYAGLLTQDPLVNANSILRKASNHLSKYNFLLNDLTSKVVRNSKLMERSARNLERSALKGNEKKAKEHFDKLYDGLTAYIKILIDIIPKMSEEFSNAIISALRTISIIRENELESVMPFSSINSFIPSLVASLEGVTKAIESTEEGISQWPEINLDFTISTKEISALHSDLVDSINNSIELLHKLNYEADRN